MTTSKKDGLFIPYEDMRPSFIADLVRALEADIENECDEERQIKLRAEADDLRQALDDIAGMTPEEISGIAPNINLNIGMRELAGYRDAAGFDEELADAIAGLKIDPRLVAFLIRQFLPETGKPFNRGQKLFWLEVDEHIGPDYRGQLRAAGNFIKRFNEFE